MMLIRNCVRTFSVIVLLLGLTQLATSQTQSSSVTVDRSAAAASTAIPRLVKFSGVVRNLQGVVGMTFALYKEQSGGAPLWLETQNVEVDAVGRYTVHLGFNHSGGVPAELFANGEARWLGVQPDGHAELERVLLVSVPYALSAGNAETLGGLPASAYMLAGPVSSATSLSMNASVSSTQTGSSYATSGTAGSIAMFTNATDLGNSAIWQYGSNVGIGTNAPGRILHIKGPNPDIRLEDTHFANSFWELQQSAYMDDWFGFLRYESNAAVPTKSLIITNTGNFGFGISNAYGNMSEKVNIGPGSLKLWGTPGTDGIIFPDGSKLTSATAFVGSSTGAVINATQNGAGISNPGPSTPPPSAVLGTANATTGVATGVLGVSNNSPDGAGVLGVNTALTPAGSGSSAPGVWGINFNGINGVGVFGQANEATNTNDANGYPIGVYGYAKSTIGVGVGGVDDATTGKTTGVWGGVDSTDGFGVEGDAYATTGTAVGVAGFSDANSGKGVVGYATSTTGATVGVRGNVVSPSGVAGLFENTGGGDVLIGRNAIGTTNVFRVENSGVVHGGSFLTTGADFAESFVVRGSKAQYEAGDLLAIDEHSNRSLSLTHEAYSTLVAGVYSTKPGMLASPYAVSDHGKLTNEVPLAVVGVVPLKVTAENGTIQRGDLLVSSSKPGYAMKGTDRNRMVGAVVGKALQPLESGEGVIEVLVTLQ